MPLFHFITLIIDVRTGSAPIRTSVRWTALTEGGPIKRPMLASEFDVAPSHSCARQLSPAHLTACVDIEFALHDVRQQAEALNAPLQTNHSRTLGGFGQPNWWSQTGSNRRPHACKARALPTELWPLGSDARLKWWAWEDLNLRPHAYQARALTN